MFIQQFVLFFFISFNCELNYEKWLIAGGKFVDYMLYMKVGTWKLCVSREIMYEKGAILFGFGAIMTVDAC